jgi:hypothetical protein
MRSAARLSDLLIQRNRRRALLVSQAIDLPAPSFRFHLAMDTLAIRLTLPLVGCVMDFGEVSPAPSSRCALPDAPSKKRRLHFCRRLPTTLRVTEWLLGSRNTLIASDKLTGHIENVNLDIESSAGSKS